MIFFPFCHFITQEEGCLQEIKDTPSDIQYLPFQQTQLISLFLSQVLPSDLVFLVLSLMVFALHVA